MSICLRKDLIQQGLLQKDFLEELMLSENEQIQIEFAINDWLKLKK